MYKHVDILLFPQFLILDFHAVCLYLMLLVKVISQKNPVED